MRQTIEKTPQNSKPKTDSNSILVGIIGGGIIGGAIGSTPVSALIGGIIGGLTIGILDNKEKKKHG